MFLKNQRHKNKWLLGKDNEIIKNIKDKSIKGRPGASGSACRLWTERSQVRAVVSTYCTVCGKDLPLITSPRPRTVREPTALGTSFFLSLERWWFLFFWRKNCGGDPHSIKNLIYQKMVIPWQHRHSGLFFMWPYPNSCKAHSFECYNVHFWTS